MILQKRRFSTVIESIRSFLKPSEKQYRSLSTGDLATSRSGYENDFMEINFIEQPSTSSVSAHFDDCDRVPMSFGRGRVKIMPQTSSEARKIARFGSTGDISNVSLSDLHRAQPWFFVDVDSKCAERILFSSAGSSSTFLVSFHKGRYVLSTWQNASARHVPVRQSRGKHGDAHFQIDLDKKFGNLCDLVDYYTKHKGFVLPAKLGKGVSRPARVADSSRTRA